MKFPMILTHRANPDAQIVVANAEQLADAPKDFLPPADTSTPAVITAAAAIPGVNLDAEIADLADRRKSLDAAVDEFTAHVQAESDKLAQMRDKIDADRAQLDKDRAEFEAQRATTNSTAAGTGDIGGDTGAASSAAEGAATGDAAAAPAAPAKRARATAAKADTTGTEGA